MQFLRCSIFDEAGSESDFLCLAFKYLLMRCIKSGCTACKRFGLGRGVELEVRLASMW